MKRTAALAVLAASLMSLIALGGPASAHDEILGTNPAANSTVAAGIIDVSVSFNEPIMSTPDNAGEAIEVTGPAGSDSQTWSNGCILVSDAKASTQVDLDKPGKYTVNWRSVSNDGHPSEGSFDFTVTNSTGYQSAGLVEPGPECAGRMASPIAVTTQVNGNSAAPSTTPAQGDATLPIAVGSLAVLLVLVVGYINVRRRRKNQSN